MNNCPDPGFKPGHEMLWRTAVNVTNTSTLSDEGVPPELTAELMIQMYARAHDIIPPDVKAQIMHDVVLAGCLAWPTAWDQLFTDSVICQLGSKEALADELAKTSHRLSDHDCGNPDCPASRAVIRKGTMIIPAALGCESGFTASLYRMSVALSGGLERQTPDAQFCTCGDALRQIMDTGDSGPCNICGLPRAQHPEK